MEKLVKYSLKLKFTILITVLILIIVISFGGYFVIRERNILLNVMDEKSRLIINNFASTVKNAILTGDDLTILSTVQKINTLLDVKYAIVIDKNRQAIGHSLSKMRFKKLNNPINKKAAAYKGKKPLKQTIQLKTIIPSARDYKFPIIDYSLPVKFSGKRLATVSIGVSVETIQKSIRNMTITIIIISLVILFIGIGGTFLLTTITIKPINKLMKGVDEIGKGNLNYKIKVNTRDELRALSERFNSMTEELLIAQQKMLEQKKQEEQLQIAKEIQQGLIPNQPLILDNVEVAGYSRAAKGVSGDYFDYLQIDEERIGVLISDVSGKGVPASLVMVMIRTIFNAFIWMEGISCSEITSQINYTLGSGFLIDKFATFFFLIFNFKTGKLNFTNAGHGPLFLYRNKIKKCALQRLEAIPIGIDDTTVYQEAETQLYPGDIVTMYTDGITEAWNEAKEEYGIKRLQKNIIVNSSLSAPKLNNHIIHDVDRFVGTASQHDDMTLIIMKYKG